MRIWTWLGLVAAVGGLGLLAACSPLKLLNTLTPAGDVDTQAGLAYGPVGPRHVVSGGASPWAREGGSRAAPRGAADPPAPSTATAATGLTNADPTIDDPRWRMDVYRPEGPPPEGGWPVVVFFYGGSWNSGSRSDYAFVGRTLARHGVLAVLPDYRLYPQVRYPTFLHDSAAALARVWALAPEWQGNPGRVFVAGHSAGAYNAAMLALDPRWLARHGRSPRDLAGWIGLSGPYDFVPIRNPDVQPVFHHPDVPPDSQPIRWADRGGPPAWLAAGSDDDLVDPQRNTHALAAALRRAGVSVTDTVYDGRGHAALVAAIAPALSFLAPVTEDLIAFVRTQRERAATVTPASLPMADGRLAASPGR